MKRLIPYLVVLGLGCGVGAWFAYRHGQAREASERAERQAAWEAEKAALQAALDEAKALAAAAPGREFTPAAPTPVAARLSPAEIMARLLGLRGSGGGVSGAQMREAVYWLEELRQCGATALPVIREFLARSEEVELDTSSLQGRGARDGRLPGDFLLPPSLRLGLIDVVRRVGGAEAEFLLVTVLGSTGRGLEVAVITRCLQELAPNKYRESALAAARGLLAANLPLNATSPLDRYHRDYLFGVLSFYGDIGFANEAQAQLVRADNQIDRSALRYLQQALGAQAVTIAAQVYENPLLQTNSAAKEPLGRLALNFVGPDARANVFYQKVINDPVLTKGDRRNLIEDLNQDGFADTRNLTANDLPLIQSRISLIEQLAPSALDQVNADAFKEAYKDLVNMRAKATGQKPAQP